jgi:hypothetical protein
VEDIWDREGKGWSECVWFDEVGFDQDVSLGRFYLSYQKSVLPELGCEMGSGRPCTRLIVKAVLR